MDKISSEVSIYVQSVKSYLQKNNKSHQYFIGMSDEDEFFKHLLEISQKNFNKNGEAMLNKEQFELLRITVQAISVATKSIEETKIEDNIFIDMRGYVKICFN